MGKKIPNYLKAKHLTTGLLRFDDEKCTRCGTCASICPARSIVMPPKSKEGKKELPQLVIVTPGVTLCVACGCCLAACPNKAIEIVRGFTVNKPYYYCRLTQSEKFTYPKKY